MDHTNNLIREIQEHTAAHGVEDTATHLLVQAAAALQRQADELAAIGAGGVSGPLLGRPQGMPDLSQLIERGARAWAEINPQALREWTAPQAAPAVPTADVKVKIASNTWDSFGYILPTLKAISQGAWYWGANPRCKYIEIRIDTRDGGCILYDRERVRISPEQFAHQSHHVGKMEGWPAHIAAAPQPEAALTDREAAAQRIRDRMGIDPCKVDDPLNPRYIAGYRAGHAAGRKRAAPQPDAAPQAAPAVHHDATELLRDLKNAIDQATELRQQLNLMDEHARGEVWRWQADGTDDLATMGNRMGVLIYASDLRALVAAAPQPEAAPTQHQQALTAINSGAHAIANVMARGEIAKAVYQQVRAVFGMKIGPWSALDEDEQQSIVDSIPPAPQPEAPDLVALLHEVAACFTRTEDELPHNLLSRIDAALAAKGDKP